jgi:erythromycin esterase
MNAYYNLILLILLPLFICCEKDTKDPVDKNPLIVTLDEKLHPLSQNPLDWTDEQLGFLDALNDTRVIGLGEATHGSKEFFDAKHRIFRYLVEIHGFRVFAFEADFGESLFLNEAIQEGRTIDIKDLMLSKMHFWTWKTEEVQHLLEWMCNYNQGKNDADKIHYMGIDCQYNTYHPSFVKDYLAQSSQLLYDFSNDILDEVEAASNDRYANFNQSQYEELLTKVEGLIDSVSASESDLISSSSYKEFQLIQQILNVMKQSLIVGYRSSIDDHTINYRDEYMAENVMWLLDYFENGKIAIWAHNYHVSNTESYGGGSMGFHLKDSINDDYKILGFSFSRGSFTAVGMVGNNYTGLRAHTITNSPKEGSLNEIFSRSVNEVFAVSIDDLIPDTDWISLFKSYVLMLGIGAVFGGDLENYYSPINGEYYDLFIYFDTTQPSMILAD